MNESGRTFDAWADATTGGGAIVAESPLWRRSLAAAASAIGSLVLLCVWYFVTGFALAVAVSVAVPASWQVSPSAGPLISVVFTSVQAAALALLPRLLGWWPSLSRWTWRWAVGIGALLAGALALRLAVPGRVIPAFLSSFVWGHGIALAVVVVILFVVRPARVPRAEQAHPAGGASSEQQGSGAVHR